MKSSVIFVLGAAFGVTSTLAATTSCHANNCLRAVRNTKVPGSADCSSYLRTTTTPATRTITDYSTSSVISVSTKYDIQTDTFFDTSTSVSQITATETLPGTTSTSIIFSDPVAKRAVSPTPAYASPCSSAAAYVSACSCIGVTGPIIVTAPTPSTTITLPTTVTYTTSTESLTTATTSVTITDATITQVTTDSTATVPGPSSTVTQILPIPPKCRTPVTLYNGLRPVNINNNFATFPQGPGFTAETCCFRCHTEPDCAAFVMNFNGPTTCLLLKVPGNNGTPTGQCPAYGVVPMIYGNPPGSVGKGPCESS